MSRDSSDRRQSASKKSIETSLGEGEAQAEEAAVYARKTLERLAVQEGKKRKLFKSFSTIFYSSLTYLFVIPTLTLLHVCAETLRSTEDTLESNEYILQKSASVLRFVLFVCFCLFRKLSLHNILSTYRKYVTRPLTTVTSLTRQSSSKLALTKSHALPSSSFLFLIHSCSLCPRRPTPLPHQQHP